MILVTIGTQLPFDRLIRAVDNWAGSSGYTDIVAQTGYGTYRTSFVKSTPFINADKFDVLQRQASIIVSHAGMGGILSATELGKPLIVMPRRLSLGEHRNDHQMATARQFSGKPGIFVAEDTQDIARLLDDRDSLVGSTATASGASAELIATLQSFLSSKPTTSGSALSAPVVVSRLLRKED